MYSYNLICTFMYILVRFRGLHGDFLPIICMFLYEPDHMNSYKIVNLLTNLRKSWRMQPMVDVYEGIYMKTPNRKVLIRIRIGLEDAVNNGSVN